LCSAGGERKASANSAARGRRRAPEVEAGLVAVVHIVRVVRGKHLAKEHAPSRDERGIGRVGLASTADELEPVAPAELFNPAWKPASLHAAAARSANAWMVGIVTDAPVLFIRRTQSSTALSTSG